MAKNKYKQAVAIEESINISEDMIEYVETNQYMNLLYRKPLKSSFDNSFIGNWKYKKAERKYYKEYIKPVYNNLLTESPSFETMYAFADFIRLIERVFFYNNALDPNTTNRVCKDKLMCDSELYSPNKLILLDLEKDNVFISFRLHFNGQDQVLDIIVDYKFGKKAKMKYNIINREITYDSIHSENLMITITDRLQNAMAKLFIDYYNSL